MHFVLNASIVTSWFFEDESSLVADRVFDLIENGASAVVPMLFWFEIRSAVLVGERRGQVSINRAAAIFTKLDGANIRHTALPLGHEDIFTLARRHRLTFYDAAYLELAQRHAIGLATLDQALAKAAVAEGMALVGA